MNCKVYKSSKPKQLSYRITKKLIDTIYNKARTVKKKGELIISIPCDEKYNYTLNCLITKVKK